MVMVSVYFGCFVTGHNFFFTECLMITPAAASGYTGFDLIFVHVKTNGEDWYSKRLISTTHGV